LISVTHQEIVECGRDARAPRCAAFALAVLMLPCAGCKRVTVTSPAASAAAVDPWKEAVRKVEQDRGEAMGRKAPVDVPNELRHYADRRRFLAVQAADSLAQVAAIPHDFAGLVLSIQRHQFFEMKPLGEDYILYGVGQNAGGAPFAHYDRATRQDIPLTPTDGDFKEEVIRALDSVKETKARLAYLEVEWRRAPKRDRARRAALLTEVSQARKVLASANAKGKLIAGFYSDPELRESLLGEYRLLSGLARDFEGEAYDLNDADARRRLKIRLLSFIRPEARDLLTQFARDYRKKFDRPLPVSSLVRPEQYQRELVGINANAARGSAPPHSTGLAFDIYYGYMSTAEQEYLMSEIARLKAAGRVEALREARENIHVYVFANGQRPDEKLISRAIARVRSGRSSKKAGAASQR
jgi:Family of unknown function (DUF5715)